jgi:predicted TPR repeat methyltransferase
MRNDANHAIGTSGDLLTDRRFLWARSALERGDDEAAQGLLEDIVAAAPSWAPGWFALGEALEGREPQSAVRAFRESLRCDPRDVLGAALRAARLSDKEFAPPSAAYVTALFDQYAPRFEAHLTGALAYDGPQALATAVSGHEPGRRFGLVLDLGCGTGLAGRAFAAVSDRLVGVDLSPAMAQRARATGIYERVDSDDLLAFLGRCPAESADLVLAADVLAYLPGLPAPFTAARRALRVGGLFALTLQRSREELEVELGPDLRYAFSRRAIERAAVGSGFGLVDLQARSTRREKGLESPGWVVLLVAA